MRMIQHRTIGYPPHTGCTRKALCHPRRRPSKELWYRTWSAHEFMMHRPVPGLSRNDRKGKMVPAKMHSFPWRPIWVPLRSPEQWHPAEVMCRRNTFVRARQGARCP